MASVSLDEQLAVFRRNRFMALPIAGMVVWFAIGVAGAWLPPERAALAVYIGTGMIFYLALGVARLLGEDMLGRRRTGNFFDRLFLGAIAMALMVFAIAVPFGMRDPASVPLSIGVLTGLMWIPLSILIGHWVGFFHALTRTVLLVTAWYVWPEHRFVVLPGIIVVIYAISLVALARRWSGLRVVV